VVLDDLPLAVALLKDDSHARQAGGGAVAGEANSGCQVERWSS
jgi:hypothetical protein